MSTSLHDIQHFTTLTSNGKDLPIHETVVEYKPEWKDANGFLTGFLSAMDTEHVRQLRSEGNRVYVVGHQFRKPRRVEDTFQFPLMFLFYHTAIGQPAVVQQMSDGKTAFIQATLICVRDKHDKILAMYELFTDTLTGESTWTLTRERRLRHLEVAATLTPLNRLQMYETIHFRLRKYFNTPRDLKADARAAAWAQATQGTYLVMFSSGEASADNLANLTAPPHAAELAVYHDIVYGGILQPENHDRIVAALDVLRDIYLRDHE